MKILIDGCVFSQSGQAPAFEFWTHLVPLLVDCLPKQSVFFLNRNSGKAFLECEGLRNLFAPPAEFDRSAIEDRRLAALCLELEIDMFISTYNTSAGVLVDSLFVVYPEIGLPPADSSDDIAIQISSRRALRMASGYLALSKQAIDVLKDIGIQNEVWQAQVDAREVSNYNWQGLSEQFVLALRQLHERKQPEHVRVRRMVEEEVVKAQALSLKRSDEQKAVEAHATRFETVKENVSTSQYRQYAIRFYRAMKNPHRWPDYASRLYRWIRRVIS
jgi:hypothetical protein